jgi:outer membrane protein assembly factor BamB
MSIFATLLLLAAQDNDHLLINEVSESFNRQWASDEESRNYKELLGLYAVAHDTLKGKLARPDPEIDRWIPIGRVLAAKLASLPPSALEAHEIVARQVLETTLEPGERRKAIEKYAYTQVGREALDLMANGDCDQGRLDAAMRGWSRALEVRPTVETVARLALAHSVRKDGVSLSTLRAQAEARGIRGEILVEGRKRELFEYIDSLQPIRSAAPPKDPPAQPSPAPTSEIPLGHYDLKDDGRYGERMAVSLPAAGFANGKDLVVVSNGLRVTALSTALADGGSIDDAVEWRFPKNAPTRTWTLGTYNSTTLPYVGVTVSGNRAFCPMFPERQEARQQMGRRSQKFLGPSVLRAIDLATGESLWDTDSVTVEMPPPPSLASSPAGSGARPQAPTKRPNDGSRMPLIEYLDLEKSDFCFGGPPVVRGDRVYSAVMTSPFTGRQCWALCLDARNGQPIWCTDLGTAPQTKEMSVALLAEGDGTVVISTNYGVIAALDSTTGDFEWLVKYMGTRPKRSQHRPAASPPVIAGSQVYVLAQDCDELLAYDRWTGLEAALPKPTQEIVWSDLVHFIGRADEWLVFSGPRNIALRPLDGQVVSLPEAENGRFGRGTVAGGLLYLPTRTELSVFDTQTWKQVESLKWPEATTPGNTIVSGPVFVHMSDRLDLFTSGDLLKARFGLATGGPAKQQELRQVARIFESAGLLKESVPYYRRALKILEKDPAWQQTADGLRKKLADLSEKLGADFPEE